MNISDFPELALCEKKYLSSHSGSKMPVVRASTLVGSLAHHMICNVPGTPYEFPKLIKYDDISRSLDDIQRQAEIIAEEVMVTLDAEGWIVMEAEVLLEVGDDKGRYDYRLCNMETGDEAIVDLKTGQDVGQSWIQVGGYLWMEGVQDRDHYAEWGGIIHARRRPLSRETEALTEFRPADDLINEFELRWRRAKDLHGGHKPLSTPGLHCARCSLSRCPVRSKPQMEEI